MNNMNNCNNNQPINNPNNQGQLSNNNQPQMNYSYNKPMNYSQNNIMESSFNQQQGTPNSLSNSVQLNNSNNQINNKDLGNSSPGPLLYKPQ